jgi:hypothetical protein
MRRQHMPRILRGSPCSQAEHLRATAACVAALEAEMYWNEVDGRA